MKEEGQTAHILSTNSYYNFKLMIWNCLVQKSDRHSHSVDLGAYTGQTVTMQQFLL